MLNGSAAQLAAHNAKFDLGVLKRHGMAVDRPIYDTMVAQFAIDPFARGALGLKRLAMITSAGTCRRSSSSSATANTSAPCATCR